MLKGYLIEKYSNMAEAYACNRLVEEAAKRGIALSIVGAMDVAVTQEGVFHKGKKLEQCDFILYRYKYGRIKDEIGALARRTYNEVSAFDTYINKYMQIKNLSSDGFLKPGYALGTGYTDYEYLTEMLGEVFVAKGLESAQGAEVFLIDSKDAFMELRQSYPPEKEYLFEEYIAESYGRDIRFYSIRGEVIACMTRKAKSGFKANVALGAEVESFPIDAHIRQAAKDIYEQTGLDFLGIDLLFGREKPYFCEINVMPGMEGMERATGVNVAGAVMDTILGDFT